MGGERERERERERSRPDQRVNPQHFAVGDNTLPTRASQPGQMTSYSLCLTVC